MSTNNDGGPAFPHQPVVNANGDTILYGDCGMSLRDWFAGQALAGMLSNDNLINHNNEFPATNIRACWVIADAMLAARNEPKQN